MGRFRLKLIAIIFMTYAMFACIDPYTPNLTNFKSVLVVDALLTDENASSRVVITRSMKTAGKVPVKVTGALVRITDDLGSSTTLTETSKGIYKTDSLTFRAESGRSYTLYIKTSDGNEYQSDPSLMSPVQDIDSIYYRTGEETNDSTTVKGLRIFIDSNGESDCQFYRWSSEEWWKFSIPNPKRYEYMGKSKFTEYTPIHQTCWATYNSYDINIASAEEGQSNKFSQKPVLFIASGKSDRLLMQYYVKVRQMSLSRKEYEFWKSMSQINESGGDIFDKQPFEISGNIHCLNKPGEPVLGYFQVSGVKSKSMFINYRDIEDLDIPFYVYECKELAYGPSDFPPDPRVQNDPPTFDEIYSWYNNSEYMFIEPLFSSDSTLRKLVFAPRVCADCVLRGNLKKPDFWIDSE